jgi:plastocyanin
VGDGLPHLRPGGGREGLLSRRLACIALAALLLSSACERASTSSPLAARTPTPLDHAATGTIDGRVRFAGTAPAPHTVPGIASDPTCIAAHPGGLAIQDVRVEDGRLADVLVYVARGLADRVFAVPTTPVVVDQVGCMYQPTVVGAQVGQEIQFDNGDDTLHNVHGEPTKSPAWNFGLGAKGAHRAITIDHAEVPVAVRCDVHPWMLASIGVVDHPYFAVTSTAGTFTLGDVPAGHYTLAAWHPTLGTREVEVDVVAGKTSAVELTFAAP